MSRRSEQDNYDVDEDGYLSIRLGRDIDDDEDEDLDDEVPELDFSHTDSRLESRELRRLIGADEDEELIEELAGIGLDD